LALVMSIPSAAGAATNAAPAAAPASTPQERARDLIEPAVVYLEIDWKTWVNTHGDIPGDYIGPYEFTMRCSGFFVNPSGYIATAGHCVDPGENGALPTALSMAVVDLADAGLIPSSDTSMNNVFNHALGYWTLEGAVAGSAPTRTVVAQHGVAVVGKQASEWGPARVIEFKPWEDGDVALLKVEATNMPVITMASDSQIETGTQVLSVGYPASSDAVNDQSLSPTFKDGQVNTKKSRGNGLLPVYEVSAALSGGMSGGPTVNLNGDVVGINSYSLSGETEAFNYITPASLVSEMLSRNGVKNELGQVDTLYRDGLDAYFAGKYKTAITAFQAVLDRVPSHQLAQQMKTKAVEAQSLVKSSGSSSLPLILGIAAAVLLLGGGGTFFMLRRRRRVPALAPAGMAQPTAVPTGVAQPATTAPMAAPPTTQPAPWPAAEELPEEEKVPATDEVAFCSHCGTHVAADEFFCPHCGEPVHKTPEHH